MAIQLIFDEFLTIDDDYTKGEPIWDEKAHENTLKRWYNDIIVKTIINAVNNGKIKEAIIGLQHIEADFYEESLKTIREATMKGKGNEQEDKGE